MSTTKRVPLAALSDSPAARFEFLAEFTGFRPQDWTLIADSIGVVGPVLPSILDALYDHLLSFDDTRKIFLGARGEIDPHYMAERKEHLTTWVLRIADGGTNPAELAEYLSQVGRRHTGVAGEPGREVPPRYLVALTSFIQTALLSTLWAELPNDGAKAVRMGLAWNKLLMIQLELFLKAAAPKWPTWDEKA